LRYRPRKPITLGVDIGGTKIKTALVDSNDQILSTRKIFTNSNKTPDGVIEDILECVKECLDEVELEAEALVIGVAAQVDTDGVLISSPNLNWQNVHFKEKLEKRIDLPVFVTNDVRAAAWGEWQCGSGKGATDLAVLFVGTGIGGSIISGGRMLLGCSNSCGELGHITIVAEGRKCHCPNTGCLEAYAGGWAIAERAQEAAIADCDRGKFLISLAGNLKEISAATVSQAFTRGDPLAIQIVEETGKYLAAGVVSIVNVFNPCLFILGGGVIEGLPELISLVEKETRHKALESSLKNLKIVKATLGDNAGVIGAARLARREIL